MTAGAPIPAQEAGPGPGAGPARRSVLTELGMAALVVGVGVFLLVDTTRLRVPATTNVIGPKFFPTVVGVLLVVVGALLAVEVVRGHRGEPEVSEDVDPRVPADWRTLGLLGVALGAHLALLLLIGYVAAAAVLFWGAAFALGSRRFLRDAVVAVALGIVLYVGFTRGLGLTLPEGPLEAMLG